MPELTTAGEPERAPHPDASMALLTVQAWNALDPGYAEAAARRAESGGPDLVRHPTRFAAPAVVIGFVLVGLLLATAAVQVRQRQPSVATVRQSLIEEIDERTQQTDAIQRDLDKLRTEVALAQQKTLAATVSGTAAIERLDQLAVATGVVPLTGPGATVTVDDADKEPNPVSDTPRVDASDDPTRILDSDLQILVNGLWAAGADAISVNGQRLTSLSAIRSAGAAILVDYRPMTRPYVVHAIGDPQRLEPAFADNVAGRYLKTLQTAYGIRFDVTRAESVQIPGASGITLRYAEVED